MHLPNAQGLVSGTISKTTCQHILLGKPAQILPIPKGSFKVGSLVEINGSTKQKRTSNVTKANLAKSTASFFLSKIGSQINKPQTAVKEQIVDVATSKCVPIKPKPTVKQQIVDVSPSKFISNQPQTVVKEHVIVDVSPSKIIPNQPKTSLIKHIVDVVSSKCVPIKPTTVKDHIVEVSPSNVIQNSPQTAVKQHLVDIPASKIIPIKPKMSEKEHILDVSTSNLIPIEPKSTVKEHAIADVLPSNVIQNKPKTAVKKHIIEFSTSKFVLNQSQTAVEKHIIDVSTSNFIPTKPKPTLKRHIVAVSPSKLNPFKPKTTVKATAVVARICNIKNLPPNVVLQVVTPRSTSIQNASKYDTEKPLFNRKNMQRVQSESTETSDNNKTAISVGSIKPVSSINAASELKIDTNIPRQKTRSIANDGEVSFKVHNATTCFVCNIVFSDNFHLKEHIKSDNFICRVCLKEFKNHSELEHDFTSHDGRKCNKCSEVFFCQQDINRHFKSSESCKPVRKQRQYPCDVCKKAFTRETFLIQHKIKNHTNSGNVQCVVCLKECISQKHLASHARSTHVAFEYITCTFCNKLYLGPEKLKAHMQVTHFETMKNNTFLCEICSKEFNQEILFKRHFETHDQTENKCEICGRTIIGSRSALQAHIRYHHSDNIFSCKICPEIKNLTHREMISHRRKKHRPNKQTPVSCRICDKQFKSPGVLKKHYTVHFDERRYKCQVCEASFKQPETLRIHRRTHSDVLPYTCKHCGKSFRWKQTFDKHESKCKGPQDSSDSDD